MNYKTAMLSILILLFCSNTFCQLKINSPYNKFETAPFINSLIGGLIGLPIGYLIYNSDPKPHGFTALAPFIIPTMGAIISFNLSSKPR